MEGHSNGYPHANDWRSHHAPDLRQKVISAIVEKLKICFPTHIDGINKTAITFENKIYGEAKDQDDYLRKICEKIRAFSRKFGTGSSANGDHTPNPAQSLNQGQSLPTSLTYAQTQPNQQRLPQSNIQSNLNNPHSSGLSTQVPITVSPAQNLNIKVESNLGPGPQRQTQGRQQLLQQPQQQQQSSNTMFQHLMDQKLRKEKMHHQQSLLRQQQLPHHTSLSPIKQSFPHSSSLSSQPSPSQQNSQFLSRHHDIPTQRVHSSHQQQMDVPSQKHNHLTSPQNNGEKQGTSQQNNMASFNVHRSSLLGTQGQEMEQSQNRILNQHLDDKQRVQTSGSFHQRQNLADQKNQPYQLQTAHLTNPSTCQDSTSKTLNTSVGGDWREETYQKIKALREKYIIVLTTMFQSISDKLQAIDSLPQHKSIAYEMVKKLRAGRAALEQVIAFLNISRDNVSENHRDRFSQYEAYVLKFTNSQRAKQQQQQQQQVHIPPSQTNQTSLQSQSGQQVHVSQTAMPKIEPTDENKVMSSSGNVLVHSLKQNPQQQQVQRVNSKAELFQQQHLSSSQRQLQKAMPCPASMSPLASSPQKQNNLVEQQTLPTTLNKTESQEHPPPEPITERPIDRLIKAIQSSSAESLAQSVSEMSSVISLSDRFAGSFHSTRGSRPRFAEDLSERTRLRLQQQGDTNPNKRFKRSVTAIPLDSTASRVNNIEPSYALLQEINEINGRLVETVVSICNEDVGPYEVTSGTVVVKCSYVPVALSSTFKALYNSGHISQIQPLRLIVPENYPNSPIILDKALFDTASVHKYEDLSARASSRFGLSIKEYSEPMSLKEIAKVWDECARATMVEYAERHGGGTFSSKYGHWESVLRAS